ncbi:serine hydrolase domain-containing protein [Hufsiella ginkgonis]|uniref:Serine hydrolase n=1 Tax=Hufsiella ginkgonis TaxID=2695274 RepID=A0A7K1Y0G9_9SPHI|nr:serine hydrolase [Hufsiella ginkgonis]MXV16577.1 serine hydrolase [Hufsiella ginkgonis]
MKAVFHTMLCAYLLTLAIQGYAQKKSKAVYFPEPGKWEHRSPAQVGMRDSLVKEAVAFAVAAESTTPKDLKLNHYQTFGKEPFGTAAGPFSDRGAAAGLIIRNGYIVAEWGDPLRADQTFSVAKSFLSSTAGVAFDRGMIADLADKVAGYMGPIVPYDPFNLSRNKSDAMAQSDMISLFDTEHNRKIRWDDLLRQTSDWEGTLWGKPDWADRPAADANTWLTRARTGPGAVYEYNDTRVNVLALALLNIWRKPLPVVLKENIMDPIGASNTWRWLGYDNSWVVIDGQPMQSVSGGSHWGGGLFISAYDQARFGYLTLNRGKWNGKQLLSEKWISMALTPGPAQKTYGFMNYFLNTDKQLLPDAPASAFYHLGAGNNMVYVDTENNLVIVSRWIRTTNDMNGLVKRVIASLISEIK